MAGHNFLRYMLNFWPAPFAPFYFLFTSIRRFFQTIEKRTTASLPPPPPPPPKSPPPSSPSTPPTHTTSSKPPPTNIITKADRLPTVSLLPCSPHDKGSSRSIAGEDLLALTAAGGLPAHDNDINPDHAAGPLLSQNPGQDQPVDMTKRRAGRARGGAKAPIHQSTIVTPAIPVVPATDTIQGWPASANQSDTSTPGDTVFTPNHPNRPEFTSLTQGDDNRPRGGGPSISQQQPADNKKENVAPLKENGTANKTASLHSPAPAPLATADNTREPQKPGTGSRLAINSANTATTDSMCDEASTSCSTAEQLHAIADRLTLDDALPSQKPAQKTTLTTLSEPTTAAETSALPVPLIVAVPVPRQPQTAQPGTQTPPGPNLPGLVEPTTDEERAEREYHLGFMREALDMGDLALKTNETPVGCVLVYRGRIIAKGMNATNITRNGTRHAEFMALSALLSRREVGDVTMADTNPDLDDAKWGDVDPKDGHIYPYGQKLHPAPIVSRSIISECVLYVTVEPCVMCASLLRQLSIKKVYFGAVNDKFGGTGGVFRVHMNSKPVAIPKDRPYQQGYGPQDVTLISKGRAIAVPRGDDEGDGGNVESGYPVEGGYLRDDAVSLLRRFYVQENGRAPQPRKKEGRAARLYAALETQTKTPNISDLSDNTPETPVEAEAPMMLGGKPDSNIGVVCMSKSSDGDPFTLSSVESH